MHRRVAVALVVVLAAMNFTAAAPFVPTLPHRSWGLEQWVMPWPIQVAHAATEAADEPSGQDYVQTAGYDQLDDMIIGLALGYLFNEFVEGWRSLVEWFFSP